MKKLLVLLLLGPLLLCGQSQYEGLFIFGHSLIDHRPPAIPTPSDETTVPHWLYLLAAEAGHTVAAGGQYGFLTSHRNLPPVSQWGYDLVPGVWDEDTESFAEANITATLITVGNFIQNDMLPTDDYYGPENVGVSPLTATHDIVDWVELQRPGAKVYLYENWPETNLAFPPPMTPPSYPLSEAEFATYNTYTQAAFHDWWVSYHNALLASRPDLNIRMIPVGPVLAKLFSGSLGENIPYTELYEDLDPHGRASLYFLAALITYAAIFEEPAPSTFSVPAIVHEDLRTNYAAINSFIWSELLAFNTPTGESRVFVSDVLSANLTSFTATSNADNVLLEWTSASEDNMARYAVERSGADQNFVEIGSVVARNEPADYSFTDADPLMGQSTYRLRIIELDGAEEFSSLLSVNRDGTSSIGFRPLGNGAFQLSELPLNTTYYVTDSSGRIVLRGVTTATTQNINVPADRLNGIGFLVIDMPSGPPVQFKLIVIN